MARPKQTARKSKSTMAPRRQLVTRSKNPVNTDQTENNTASKTPPSTIASRLELPATPTKTQPQPKLKSKPHKLKQEIHLDKSVKSISPISNTNTNSNTFAIDMDNISDNSQIRNILALSKVQNISSNASIGSLEPITSPVLNAKKLKVASNSPYSD